MTITVDGWVIDQSAIVAVGPVTTEVFDYTASATDETIHYVTLSLAIQLAGERILLERRQDTVSLETIELVKTQFKNELEAIRTKVLDEMADWWI